MGLLAPCVDTFLNSGTKRVGITEPEGKMQLSVQLRINLLCQTVRLLKCSIFNAA